jgi:hypothetical protein
VKHSQRDFLTFVLKSVGEAWEAYIALPYIRTQIWRISSCVISEGIDKGASFGCGIMVRYGYGEHRLQIQG